MRSLSFSLVIVHEDGAVISVSDLPEQVAKWRFEAACRTQSVVYAHYSNDRYERCNSYNRDGGV